MNTFSKNIYIEILLRFPELIFENLSVDEYLVLKIENLCNAKIGNLIIRTLEDNSIWIQNYFPNSSYSVDDVEELEYLIKNIIEENILWVIANKNNIWYETTLINNLSQIEKEKNVEYQILSWSGKKDIIYK